MTRAEMADRLEDVLLANPGLKVQEAVAICDAAALLRQTCKGCRWHRMSDLRCLQFDVHVAEDGFCHAWEAKP